MGWAIQKKQPKKDDSFGGGLLYAAEKLGLGAVQSVEGMVDFLAGGIADIFGADEWAERQFRNTWLDYTHADQWYDAKGAWKVVGDVAGGIGTSVPSIAIGALLAIPTGGASVLATGASLGATALSSAGMATSEALEKTGELTGKEYLYGALVGGTEGVIEWASQKIGFGSGRITKSLANALGREAAEATTEAVVKQGIKGTLKNLGKNAVMDFMGEATEEMIAEFAAPIYERMTINPNAKLATAEEIGYAGFVGGLSGLVMGSGTSAIQSAAYIRKGSKVQKEGNVNVLLAAAEEAAALEKQYGGDNGIQETYDKLKDSLANEKPNAAQKVAQQRLIGELSVKVAVSEVMPVMMSAASQVVSNVDAVVQSVNDFGYTDAEGNPVNITREELLGSLNPETMTAEDVRKELQNNQYLAHFAAASTFNTMMMNADLFADNAVSGEKNITDEDVAAFVRSADPNKMRALSEALGIDDWSAETGESMTARRELLRESGALDKARAKMASRSEFASVTEKKSGVPLALTSMEDGIKRYADGSTDIGIKKDGDTYTVYDYNSGEISRDLTRGEVNKALKEFAEKRNEAKTKKEGKVTVDESIDESRLSRIQKQSLKAVRAISKAIGVDIVVFESETETVTDAKGKTKTVRKGYNGKYNPKTKTVYVDIAAGMDGEGTVLFTLSHELTHHIKNTSPAMYKAFQDFLLENYGKKGVQVGVLVARQMAKAKSNGRSLSYAQALDEVIADSCESFLADPKIVDKILGIKKTNLTLWETIKAFLEGIFTKVNNAYRKLNPDSVEGKIAKSMVDVVGDLKDKWAEALLTSEEESGLMSFLSLDENTDTVNVSNVTSYSYRSLAEAAGFTAVENEDGTRSFMRDGKAVSKVTVEDIENSPIGAFINFSLDKKDITEEQAYNQKKMFAEICTTCCTTNDFSMTMQFVGSVVFTAMKANADKQYGTTYDFVSICTKTQAVIDAMSAKMVKLGRGLNNAEILKIYQEVVASGNPVPCPECYVFSRWVGIGGLLSNIKNYQDLYGAMELGDVAREYRKMHAELEKEVAEKGISSGKAKGKIADVLTKEYNALKEKIEKQTNKGEKVDKADTKRLAELEPMIATAKAMTWIKKVYFADSAMTKRNKNFIVPDDVLFDLNMGEVFATQYKEAWAFRTTQGAGYGKAITPYADAVLGEGVLVTNNTAGTIKKKANKELSNPFLAQKGKMDKKAVAILERARKKQKNQAFLGGQRLQSTSDARYENASDYLLAALELQAMHGMAQVYTKVDGAVAAFDAWGMSSNQSLMPLGGGLDSEGNVVDSKTGGMLPALAFENRRKFETSGTITIGVNDNHIRAMFPLRDRDFIIPYHASGGNQELIGEFRRAQEVDAKRVQAVNSTDYTRTQSDKVLSDDVLKWLGKSDEEISRIKDVRAARIAILTRKSPNMEVVRSNKFLSALYDKLNGGEFDGVVLPESKIGSQIYPNEFWDKSVSYDESGKITRDYLEYCEDLGFLHRFSGTVPRNGKLVPIYGYDEKGNRVQLTDLAYKYDGDTKTDTVEDFYWSVLTDRRMYGNDGMYLPQKYVTLSDTTPDTVKNFAKNNYGRQYNAERSRKAAEKIANGEPITEQLSDRDSFAESVAEEGYEGEVLSFALDRYDAGLWRFDDNKERYDKEVELYSKYQDGEATKENFFYSTIATFEPVKYRPKRKPDFVSYSRQGAVSSEYWYTDDGVIRGSDHWGWGVATCDWFYGDNQYKRNAKHQGNKEYGKAKWSDFLYKTGIIKTKKRAILLTFNNSVGKGDYKEDGKRYSRAYDGEYLNIEDYSDVLYSLRDVTPVEPTTGKWQRTLTTEEVKKRFPNLWDVSADESEVRNPTQISGTVKTYRKVYEFLKESGFKGTILDASSGLGYGTRAGIEEYGFDVEDIEPYPDKSYTPKYTDYSSLDKKYDVIISNAVLNVLPQDQRDALVVKMGELLKDGGRMFINVRGDDVEKASSKVAINEDLKEYYISKSGSYQKGFTQKELVAYLEDALGDEFTVAPVTFFGKVSAIVTKKESQALYSDRTQHIDKAVEEFGYTPYFSDAGYILPDGKMLNFSGEKDKHYGGRGLDHRAIAAVYDDAKGTPVIARFMAEGNIRVNAASQGIDLGISAEPTVSQYNTISRFISECKKKGRFYVDFTDAEGNSVGSLSYEDRFSTDQVITDIKEYYRTGVVPDQDYYQSREVKQSLDSAKGMTDEKAMRIIKRYASAKSYTKGYAKRVLKEILGDTVLGSKKTYNELSNVIWKVMDEAPPANKADTVAEDVAEYITDMLLKESDVSAQYLKARETMQYFNDGYGRIVFSEEDLIALEKILGENGLTKLREKWGHQKGKRFPISMSDYVRKKTELGTPWMSLQMKKDAEAFVEIAKIYDSALKESADGETAVTSSEIEFITGYIKRSILNAYSKYRKSLAYNLEECKELLDLYNAINSKDGRKMIQMTTYKIGRLKDLKIGKYKRLSSVDNDTFKKTIGLLANTTIQGGISLTKMGKALRELSAWYSQDSVKKGFFGYSEGDDKKVINNGAWDGDIALAMDYLWKKQVIEHEAYTKSDYKMLYDVLNYFEKFISNYEKVWRNGQYVEAAPIAKEMYDKLLDGIEFHSAAKSKALAAFRAKARSAFGYILDPEAAIHSMEGYSDGFFTQEYENLREAAKNVEVEKMNVLREHDEFMDAHPNYLRDATKGKTGIVIFNGKEVTRMSLIQLYMTFKRKHAQEGLIRGGVTFDSVDGDGKTTISGDPEAKVSADLIDASMAEIDRYLTVEDHEYIAMVEKAYESCKVLKAQRDFAKYGKTNVIDGYYVPIKRYGRAISVDTNMWEEMDRVSHLSFNKDTVEGANSSLYIEDAERVLMRHVRGICLYHHLSPVIDEFNMIANIDLGVNPLQATTIATESSNAGIKAMKYLSDMISDVQGIGADNSGINRLVGAIRGGYAAFQIGGNPKVWATQFTSLVASTSILDADSVAQGLTIPSSDVDEYCDLAELRHYDNAAARAMSLADKSKTGTILSRISEKSTALIGACDRVVIGRLFGACQVQAEKNTGHKVGTKENKREAGKLLEKVIFQTQQNSLMTEKSSMMRSKQELAKSLTMFSADAMKVFGRVYDSFGYLSYLQEKKKRQSDSVSEEDLKTARKKLGKAVGAWVSQALAMVGITMLFNFLYNKTVKRDEDETKGEAILKDCFFGFIGNLLGGMPLIRDISGYFIDGYEIGYNVYDSVNETVKAVENLSKFVTPDATSQERASAIKGAVNAIGMITGIPTRNVYNAVTGLIRRFSEPTGYAIDSVFYEKNYESDLDDAIEDGDEEMVDYLLGLIYDNAGFSGLPEKANKELVRLANNGKKILPKTVPDKKSINGEEVELTDSQKQDLADIYTANVNKTIGKLVNMGAYTKMSDEDKEITLKNLYDLCMDDANTSVLDINNGEKHSVSSAIGYAKYAVYMTKIAPANKETKDKRQKKLEAIKKLSFTEEEKLMLFAKDYALKDGDFGTAKSAKTRLLRYILSLSLSKEEREILAKSCGFKVENGSIKQDW